MVIAVLLLLDGKFAQLKRHRPNGLRLTIGVRLWTSIDPRLVNKRTAVKWSTSTSRGTNIAGSFCGSGYSYDSFDSSFGY